MKAWGRHMAFFERAGRIAELGDRLRGLHLITPNAGCGEPGLLLYLGAEKRAITLVVPASEDLLELADAVPGMRYIADDFSGAVRDNPRKLVTARLDANGVLTDDFADKVRQIVAHGMAEEGRLTVTFAVPAEDSEVGEMGHYIEQAPRNASYMTSEPSMGTRPRHVLRILDRLEAMRYFVDKRVGLRSFWEPELLQFYPLREVDTFEVVVFGPVRRRSPKETRLVRTDEVSFRALPISASSFTHSEQIIHVDVHAAAKALSATGCPPALQASLIGTLFHLTPEEVKPWIESPPSLSIRPLSEPSLSAISRNASRRSRLFRG